MKLKSYIPVFLAFSLFSCSPKNKKALTYFNNLPDSTYTVKQVENKTEQRIKVDDVLSVKVSTLNAESNTLFNAGVLTGAQSENALNEGYKVDKNGDINFPVLGKISLANKTLEEAQDLITQKISTQVKNPIVNVRLLNAQVSVLGEVGAPGIINISARKTTILEALGKAGDITATGRKDNVLLIRENGDKREMIRLNMNDVVTMSSPFYYLQQNDVIIVEATRRKQRQTKGIPDAITISSLTLSSVATILGLFSTIRYLKN
ncbi:polysaccharide biosynthesis/export family protein [Taibaiella sp. KBW10]|uniref:polysaccharide biosynthesis/export family protein n=1 Tax=Taibaiella sp. KBW10 TaxID=2153357 RepID=UPI0013157407|nr:polysaccharide biosynthesis/export family protein [Taibaiella sp. KBW10]